MSDIKRGHPYIETTLYCFEHGKNISKSQHFKSLQSEEYVVVAVTIISQNRKV